MSKFEPVKNISDRVGHQGLKSQVNPVVNRTPGAALFMPISNPASQMILSVIE